MSNDTHMPSDEELTAFLDGELLPDEMSRIERLLDGHDDVAQRLEFLSRSSMPFEEAFAPLLAAAPTQKLDAMLAAIPARQTPKLEAFSNRRSFLGALAASLVAGIIVDRAYIGASRSLGRNENSEWRSVVAEYISLYTPETLAGPSPANDVQVAQLDRVGQKLGLGLSPETVALPGVDFKRAQLLEYDDRPLAQIAYLDPETGPMALCIVQSAQGAKEPDIEGRKGMNVVYWSNATHAFMLIGHAPVDRMREIAESVRAKLIV